MLNATIVTAVQSLAPLWSQELVKFMAVDSGYTMIIAMLINSLTNYIKLSEQIALLLLIILITSAISWKVGWIGQFFRLFQQLGFKLVFNQPKEFTYQFVQLCQKHNIHLSQGIKYNELNENLYLLRNQIKPPLSWQIVTSVHDTSGVSLDSKYHLSEFKSNYAPKETKCKHLLETDSGLKVWIYIDKSELTVDDCLISFIWSVHLEFVHGDLTLLVNESRKSVNNRKFLYHVNDSIGANQSIIMEPIGKKYQASVWDGYYHPRKNFLQQWAKQVDQLKVKQLSIMCVGPAGTGKSELITRLSQYTQRHIVTVNLTKIKTPIEALQIFTKPFVGGDYLHPSQVIYELDELDKSIAAVTIRLNQRNRFIDRALSSGNCRIDKLVDKEEDADKDKSLLQLINDINIDLNQFLSILSGVSVPHGRIIVACANNIEAIKKICPQLLRPGRMTIFNYEHGDRKMLMEILADHNLKLEQDLEVPNDYNFIQAHLLEWLSVNKDQVSFITKKDLELWSFFK